MCIRDRLSTMKRWKYQAINTKSAIVCCDLLKQRSIDLSGGVIKTATLFSWWLVMCDVNYFILKEQAAIALMFLKTLIIMVHIDFDWDSLSVVGLRLVWMEVKSSFTRTSCHWCWIASFISSEMFCWLLSDKWLSKLPANLLQHDPPICLTVSKPVGLSLTGGEKLHCQSVVNYRLG